MSTSAILTQQVDTFIDLLESYNKKLPRPRGKKNYLFVRHFFKKFINEHNSRADEVSSAEYKKVIDLASEQFPVKTFWNYCIDGRVLSILIHGAPAGVGRSIRMPGGILREFVRNSDGQLQIFEGSVFATYLKQAFTTYQTDSIAEVFDSHVGCAARYVEEKEKGRDPKDFGLLADVSHKLQIARAAKEYVIHMSDGTQSLIGIQTSFDPHTGYMYMGLETKQAFDYARRHGNVYTDAILDTLVAKNLIISTEQLTEEESIQKELKKYLFPLKWESQYMQTGKQFWRAIAVMKKPLLPILKKKLLSIYPHLSEQATETQQELENRAVLLLTNVFSGYLNNQHPAHITHRAPKELADTVNAYPYGSHKEEAVRVSEGAYPPYKTSMFAVFNSEQENLPSHLKLMASLVRNNRNDGRITDPTNNFKTAEAFAEAAVPIIMQEIVREPVTDDEWASFSRIDWSDLPEHWDSLSDEDFYAYLSKKGLTNFSVALRINKLRRKMAILYDPYNSLSSRLMENYLIALPIVAGRYRKNHFIIPFVKLGFS